MYVVDRRSTLHSLLILCSTIAGCERSSAVAVVQPMRLADQGQLGIARVLETTEQALGPLMPGHGIAGPEELRVLDLHLDDDGTLDVRVQQELDGVPVAGGEAIVHLGPKGELLGITDNLRSDVRVDPEPALSEDDALERAVQVAGGWDVLTDEPKVELEVVRIEGEDYLSWRVQLYRLDGTAETSAPIIHVDAHTGEILSRADAIRNIGGSGKSTDRGTVSFKVVRPEAGGYCYLEDPNRDFMTLSMLGTDDSYTMVFDADTAFTWEWQRQAVDAHFAATWTYDYFKNVHGWNGVENGAWPGTVDSLAGDGQVFALYVNYGEGYNGSFWLDDAVWFGDGDGVEWDPLTAVDLVAHEMTHGVTEATADFIATGEPASVNEGYADIFAAMVEYYLEGTEGSIWRIGEDAYTPNTMVEGSSPLDAYRYLGNPSKDGVTIAHYDDLVVDATDPHVNMGIITVAFHILADGGSHPDYGGTRIEGIGISAAERVAFRALKKYSTSETDFADTRNAWLDAAMDLTYNDLDPLGTETYTTVMDVWNLVGVGLPSDTETCDGYDQAFTSALTEGNAKYYVHASGQFFADGTFSAALFGPSAADFDLFLQKLDADGAWSNMARSRTAGSSEESFTYTGAAGTYRLRVKAESGSGDFVACLSTP